MTVLADFPANGIHIDSDDTPPSIVCRAALSVLQDEYARSWNIERAYAENGMLTSSSRHKFVENRARYLEAIERLNEWMTKQGFEEPDR